MVNKGFNLFDECATEWVHLYPQEEDAILFLGAQMYPFSSTFIKKN